MSWENNPNGSQNFGGQNPGGQQGGQWGQPGQNPGGQPGGQWGAPQQGQQQGGQWGQPGQQNPGQPGQSGQWGAPQQDQQQGGQWGGQPNPGAQQGEGFGGQQGQGFGGQGFGGQGYDPNQQGYQPSQGFGGQGGYGAPPSGYAGQQPRSSNKVILFVVIGVVVAALIGAGFMFFGKSKNDPNGIDVPPPTAPATPEPTATSSPSSRPTPSSRPSSRPTTSKPSEPSGSGESVGLGISVEPASGWTVRTKKTGTVILSHSSGALFIVEVTNGSGPAVDQARRWQDTAAKGGTNATKGDVTQKPQVSPSLDVAEAEIAMNVSSGGGSQRLVVIAMVGVNDSKQTVSASQLAVPESARDQASSLVTDANKMINSVLKSQV